jgi:hypothetical protein
MSEGPYRGDDRPALNAVYLNTAEHYSDHLGWMMALARLG